MDRQIPKKRVVRTILALALLATLASALYACGLGTPAESTDPFNPSIPRISGQ